MIDALALALALLMGAPSEYAATDTHASVLPNGAGSEVVARPAPSSDAETVPASTSIPPAGENQTTTDSGAPESESGPVVETLPTVAAPGPDALVHTVESTGPVFAALCQNDHAQLAAESCPAGWTQVAVVEMDLEDMTWTRTR